MNALGRTWALGMLISFNNFVSESRCSGMDWNQMTQKSSLLEPEVSAPVSAQMGTKALLCCTPISWTKVVLITWKIALRGQPPCTISYKVETNETSKINCTDRRITWASTPDQSPDLQINTVALGHDGYYSCEVVSSEGHFQMRHDLQVLVRPEVTLFPGDNRTAVCEAIAGKPAAQIFWAPAGYHVTKNESHSNGSVTVRSAYHWEHNTVSAVVCFVSHPTGNQTLTIELNQGVTSPLHSLLTILYVKLSLLVIVLLIIGFAFFQKRNYVR
ncbi:cell surface glycoprotein CD200 receptor 2-like isoform X1 [Mesocricetus auratus]|uniref:Cell surface glycoprotein CD200 receptor 2-like isoform X1 n=1 Tax=Mesocricetus auratus TaxID=10036 RepID=A0ABM2XVM2_MESAU|nr:cell surface glycoprotein CD200 receptor 2-like isoform X1 [Mesocricetus auratus]